MGMQFLKSQRVSPKDTIRFGVTKTQYQPNLSYSAGYALPLFGGWLYNNTSATIINSQTLLLPAGSIYTVTIALFIQGINGSGYRFILVQPFANGVLLYSEDTNTITIAATMDAAHVPPVTKAYVVDCTDGVSKQIQFRTIHSTPGVSTFNLDNATMVTVNQFT